MPMSFSRELAGLLAGYLHLTVLMLSGLVLVPLLLHGLGTAGFGLWAVLGSVMAYLGLLEFGFGGAVGKFVVEFHAAGKIALLRTQVSVAGWAYGLIGGVVLVLGALLGVFARNAGLHPFPGFEGSELALFTLIGVVTALNLWGGFYHGILCSLSRIATPNLVNAGVVLLNLGLVFAALRAGTGLVGVLLASALSSLPGMLVKAVALRRALPVSPSTREFEWKRFRSTARLAGYNFMTGVVTQVIFNTDNLVIASLIGLSAVGVYVIAFRLVSTAHQLMSKIGNVFFPRTVAAFAQGDRQQFRRLCVKVTQLSLVLAAGLGVLIWTLGPKFIHLWVGPDHFVGRPTLLVMVLFLALQGMVYPASVILSGIGGERPLFLFAGAEAVLNILLSVLLAKPLGVFGVALATLVAEVTTSGWGVPRRLAQAVGMSSLEFWLACLGRPSLVLLPSLAVAWGVSRVMVLESFLEVALAAAGLLGFTLLAYSCVEREMVRGLLSSRLASPERQ
jgi:O-antigen/teichoic acid export membrane protein